VWCDVNATATENKIMAVYQFGGMPQLGLVRPLEFNELQQEQERQERRSKPVVDTIIEEKILEGQIAGKDLLTEAEQKQALLDLAKVYSDNQITYQQQRNKLQPWFG
jgi:hypothetical protein